MSTDRPHSRERIEAALQGLTEPGRLDQAQRAVGESAPDLQRILAQALEEGGWFDSAHTQAIRSALAEVDPLARERAIRTLVAEETRVGMFVGVAVGYELFRVLEGGEPDPTQTVKEK